MDNSRSMVEMHSGICEDIAGNSTNISPKGEAGGSIPFWRAKNPGNRLISGIFIDDAKYNTHKKAPGVELQEAAARQGP